MLTRHFRLDNTVQHYDWGSPTRIHELLGSTPDGRPAAELWLGAHRSAPSTVLDAAPGASTEGVSLADLVQSDPEGMLGRRVADTFGPRLPYLLKVLAADRALSLQVHPRPHHARAGFNRENLDGLPHGSPDRSFHDDQHKPEMVVALSQFEGLVGFRTPRAVLSLLDGLDGPLVATVREVLSSDRSARGIRTAFTGLVASRHDAGTPAALEVSLESVRRRLHAGSPYERADRTVMLLAEQHPGDPGALVSLLLNRVTLEPGESLFIPAGVVHAYVSGLGIEVMASSDNVLRAGLTSKRVDEAALVECAVFEPSGPTVPTVTTSGDRGQLHTYRVPVEEFGLVVADVDEDEVLTFPSDGPRIVLCLDGKAVLHGGDEDLVLARGESAFVPHRTGPLHVGGHGHVVCVWTP